MRIERVQKRGPGNAIRTPALKPCGIHGAGIATDDVISSAPRVIGIVDPELSVIKNVKGLGPELKLARLPDLEMLQQRQVEVRAPGIIEEVPAGVPESKPPRGDNLRGIADERAKALSIAQRRLLFLHHVGVRGRDAEVARNPSVVGQGNTGVAGAVDHRKRSARTNQSYTGELPAVQKPIGQRGTAIWFGRGLVLRPIVGPVTEATGKVPDRQLIYVADVKQMTFVETRAGFVLAQVVRIYKNRIASIRRVVNRVAIGVRDSERQPSAGVSYCGLQCVIARIGDVLQRKNSPQPWVGAPVEGIDVGDVWIGARRL